MNSATIRQKFLEFFESKGHKIVPSAPLVLKNDPSLLFTNSGMVQFKDNFLGNAVPQYKRVADTQKCLRVSGKHNDLEDVGLDTYHHTMFEMLGNWSFGDYFKKDAIAWAWELLTEVYVLPKDRLFVTVFGGDKNDSLPVDVEAEELWKLHIPSERILHGNKKDNFWEMGEQGPCGPCSEIHIDLRSDEEVKMKPGKELVNNDHPQVVEIWNLVFMEFNRKADGSLEKLPAQHVDTGMGFERLCMAIQKKTSNYDTDVFRPLIDFIALHANVKYGETSSSLPESGQGGEVKKDIAIRVMADHIRAVSFAIADGQLPSNTGAGYVIRRILRRAVRYGFSYLDFKEPFMYRLVPLLALQLKDVFPELHKQEDYVTRVVHEEEISFLRTLSDGILAFNSGYLKLLEKNLKDYFLKYSFDFTWLNSPDIGPNIFLKKYKKIIELSYLIDEYKVYHKPVEYRIEKEEFIENLEIIEVNPYFLIKSEFWQIDSIKEIKGMVHAFVFSDNVINGNTAFILNDTHGFPIDLTQLMAKELGLTVDMVTYNQLLEEQKSRSKSDATKETGDWVTVQQSITGKARIAAPDENWTSLAEIPKTEFIGYEQLESEIKIVKYRKIKQKNKELFQLVFDKTPFYAESGGQVGDTGVIESVNEKISIIDTKKENELIVHLAEKLPESFNSTFVALVDVRKRELTKDNHSATHLLHAALRQVLGKHVEQKGSLVNEKILRFDFSHFAAMTSVEIEKVEAMVNEKIRANIPLNEQRNVPIEKAKSLGAMALFGEKYGDFVRVITFDPRFSVELCGGTHVSATGNIGLFKILSESSVAAGVRRIEAVTAEGAQEFVNGALAVLDELKTLLKNPKDISASLQNLIEEKHLLEKKLETVYQQQANVLKDELAKKAIKSNLHTLIVEKVTVPNADTLKNIAYALRNQFDDLLMVLAADIEGKPQVAVMLGEKLEATKEFHAGNMVKELAKEIEGGGGGQPFFATAGGKNLAGLDSVLTKVRILLR